MRDIGETTRDFISRRIKTDLKGYALEPFVAALFRAMGYAAQATRRSRDDGVDVIAHRDELGIEPPILKIQVKAHEASIGADAVKAFYAMVEERDVGIFIDQRLHVGRRRLRPRPRQSAPDRRAGVHRPDPPLLRPDRPAVPPAGAVRKVLVPDVAEMA